MVSLITTKDPGSGPKIPRKLGRSHQDQKNFEILGQLRTDRSSLIHMIKVDGKTRNFCEDFEKLIKKRILESYDEPNTGTEVENKTLWSIDEDSYDWACLTGCPPGFDCSKKPIEPCWHGYSDFETKVCGNCPTGLVCTPGRLPYPCPLGQYVLSDVDNTGSQKITFAGKELELVTKYTCVDCPRESLIFYR